MKRSLCDDGGHTADPLLDIELSCPFPLFLLSKYLNDFRKWH